MHEQPPQPFRKQSMGALVGTEETPAFLCSTNAAKIMMSLKKSRPKAKIKVLGLCRAEGAHTDAWQEGALPLCFYTYFTELGGKKKKKKPNKMKQTFSASAAVFRWATKHCWP